MDDFTDQVGFNVIAKIAEGGMGAVYKAQQLGISGFEKIVAVKTLHSSLSDSDRCVNMFIQEAKLVADLVHENIVQIYHCGKTEDIYYLVLEYVDGISLHELISFHKVVSENVPKELIVFIISRIARGLAYAHSRVDSFGQPRNIVHRDICPRNIMINTEGLPKLTDFGIAKAKHIVQDNTLSGKPLFMSPEQAAKKPLDFRSDLYSLGAVMFFLLSGSYIRKPDKGVPDILKQAKDGHVQWEKLPQSLDSDLVEVLKKLLAHYPEDRYQDTAELAKELEYYIYKDGYGPTIVALSEYLRKQVPYIFSTKSQSIKPEKECTDVSGKLENAAATIPFVHETVVIGEGQQVTLGSQTRDEMATDPDLSRFLTKH